MTITEPLPNPVPYAKGWASVDYRTQLPLHRSGLTAAEAPPGDPLWDVFVGPLPFLVHASEERPYLRESAPARRDRVDVARDPGEANLDSSLWLRSWTSWHLGAGQEDAEPLETEPEVARFRFFRSAGLDVFTDGQVSLLHETTQLRGDGRFLSSVPGVGVVAACGTGVRLIKSSPPSDDLIAPDLLTKVTVNGALWMGIKDDATIRWGDLLTTGATQGAVAGITGATCLAWAKDRLWVGAGGKLHEVTDVKAGTQSVAHTFPSGRVVSIAGSSGGLYVMVDDGLTRIFVLVSEADGSLSAPREVAQLPRGERGTLLFGYMGRFLLVGTTRGVRMADAAVDDTLPVGPLIIQITGGPVDATADGNFIWVTVGSEGIDAKGDGSVMRPGLYRMDVSRVVIEGVGYGDSAASRFAYATDLYAPTSGLVRSVTVHDGLIYMVAGTAVQAPLFQQRPGFVREGWLRTGPVSFGTAERKAWQSLTATSHGPGRVGFWVDSGSGFLPVSQTLLASPFSGEAAIDMLAHPASNWLNVHMALVGDGLSTPVVTALGLRAAASPKRTRYVRVPLLAFDFEADRNNTPFGYEGFAYDRVKDLEALEESGVLVPLTDARTGETVTGLLEKVAFEGRTPPDRGRANWGGVVTITVLVMR